MVRGGPNKRENALRFSTIAHSNQVGNCFSVQNVKIQKHQHAYLVEAWNLTHRLKTEERKNTFFWNQNPQHNHV